MKPRLPKHVELFFPSDVVRYIYTYIPHLPPKVPVSPSLYKELMKLQYQTWKSSWSNTMYLKGFDDFILK
jgi:hypothetical protein